MKKTFAQLKRDLKVGTKVKTIHNYIKPQFDGEIREVAKSQTNSVGFKCMRPKWRNGEFTKELFETISWLWWRKAEFYEYEDNIVKCYEPILNEDGCLLDKQLCFVYEIIA